MDKLKANPLSVNAPAVLPNNQQTQSTANQPTPPAKSETVLKGPFTGYETFLTPAGKLYSFYMGYLATSDQDVITAALTIPGVARTDETKFPRPPERSRGRSKNATFTAFADPTQISPQELMQRAVASSNTVPQAAESTSTAS